MTDLCNMGYLGEFSKVPIIFLLIYMKKSYKILREEDEEWDEQ